MKITIVMKKTHQLSLRVSDLGKGLLQLEQKRTGESEADIVERCLIESIRTPEAFALIRKCAAEDPTLTAIFSAIQATGRFHALNEPPGRYKIPRKK